VDGMLEGPHGIPQAPATVAVSVPADMLRRRPDVRSAELVAAAQCALVGVAQADLYPSFTIFGTIGLRTSTAAGAPGKFLSGDNLFYSVGPRINWPFLNYGRLQNTVRVEDARFQQLLVGYKNAVLKAVQEVEDALTGFVKSQEAVVFEQRSVTAAQRAVEISLVQYREGAADYQRVLDAQRSLLAEQSTLTQTASSVTTNVIAVYKALGGGWELREGQPLIPESMQQEMKKRTDWGDLLTEPSGPEAKEISQPAKH
jgi:outer membrane protein TolC